MLLFVDFLIAVHSKMSENCAIPLCLPNNCKWDEQTGEYSNEEDEERTSLYVINAALERLRTIEGRNLE